MYPILVVDDERELRKQVVQILKRQGYEVEEAADGLEATQKLAEKEFPLILCDVQMPKMDGVELVKYIRENELSSAIVLITAHGNIRQAVDAIREGAFDYIEKPIDKNTIIKIVEKAERAHYMLHRMSYSAPVLKQGDSSQCIASSSGMKQIFRIVEKLARVNTSVLIRGENGTGKELVAKGLHYNSSRKDQPFVAINCAAIPDNLIESELFGHEKGAFTGADQRKIGKFQYASGGTLFLDEIGDTSPATQVKLLRVLQDHTFTPVGSNREVKADVRIIAATNRDLEKLIQEDKFREDLFYRLNVMPIFLPPLRERREDIAPLTHYFIDKFNQDHSNRIRGIDSQALAILEQFQWPGNIRELENAIEHAFILETSDQITYFSLPEYIRRATRTTAPVSASKETSKSPTPPPMGFDEMDWEKGKETFEREFIIQALKSNGGRINLTADQSNIPKNTLLRKIKKYNIDPREYTAPTADIA